MSTGCPARPEVRHQQDGACRCIPHPCRRIAALTAVSLLALNAQGSATILVVLGNSERVVVAADSRGVFVQSRGGTPASSRDTECKIAIDDRLLLGMAGALGGHGFDPAEAWRSLRGNRDTLVQRVNHLLATIRARRTTAPFEVGADLAVVGYARSDPAVAIARVRLVPDRSQPQVDTVDPRVGSPLVLVLGQTDSVNIDSIFAQMTRVRTESEMIAAFRPASRARRTAPLVSALVYATTI